MKIETAGPISFMVVGVLAAFFGALVKETMNIDPSGIYLGGGIIFVVGVFLVIDRKSAKNLFRFAT